MFGRSGLAAQQAVRQVLLRVGAAELMPAGVVGLAEQALAVVDPHVAETAVGTRSGPVAETAGTVLAHTTGSGTLEEVQVLRCRMHNPKPLLPKRHPQRCTGTARVGRSVPDPAWHRSRQGRGGPARAIGCRGRGRARTPSRTGHNSLHSTVGVPAPDRRGGDVDIDAELRTHRAQELLQQPGRGSSRSVDGRGHSFTSRPVNQPAASNVRRASSMLRGRKGSTISGNGLAASRGRLA